jgi:hypothetical protein
MLTSIPKGYFTEETTRHLQPQCGLGYRHLMRAMEAMLACQLTLTYGRYHIMMDLRQLALSEERMSYQQAEVMANILNQMSLIETRPADLLRSQDEEVDESIQTYEEYRHYLNLFKGGWFIPKVVERFCKRVYEADDYYGFKAFCNLYYYVYAEELLLYQMGEIEYKEFVDNFQEISLFNGKLTPLNGEKLKRYIKTMREVVDLYKVFFAEYCTAEKSANA